MAVSLGTMKPGNRVSLLGSSHLLIAIVAALAVGLGVSDPGVSAAASYSHPATYSGMAASGGTVEFDVSADGSAVTRFTFNDVSFGCGTFAGGSASPFRIGNEAFGGLGNANVDPNGVTSVSVQVQGSFSAAQQAQGAIRLQLYTFGSLFVCQGEALWSAWTPALPPDTTAPQTKISSGPSGKTSSRKAKFRFGSSESGSKLECKLDGKKWAACNSPKTYKNLKKGRHSFRVRALDAAGNIDSSPARRSWRVT
jgi:hypothetical protein